MVGGIPTHHGDLPAHFFLLPQKHSCFGIITSIKNEIRIGGLEARKDGCIIPFPGCEGIIKNDRHSSLVQFLTGFIGQPLGIGGIIMQKRNFLEATFLDAFGR